MINAKRLQKGVNFTVHPILLILFHFAQLAIGAGLIYTVLFGNSFNSNFPYQKEFESLFLLAVSLMIIVVIISIIFVYTKVHSITLREDELYLKRLFKDAKLISLDADFRMRRSPIYFYLVRLDVNDKKFYYIPEPQSIDQLKKLSKSLDDEQYLRTKKFIHHL